MDAADEEDHQVSQSPPSPDADGPPSFSQLAPPPDEDGPLVVPLMLPTDERIYTKVKELMDDIPDKGAVTSRELRGRLELALGLAPGLLYDKKAMLEQFCVGILEDKPGPTFESLSGALSVGQAVAPMNMARALAAVAGLSMRKRPIPAFVPHYEPNIGLCDLNIVDWNARNPVKHLVDIIVGYDGPMDAAQVQCNIIDAEPEKLPVVLRPPVGHLPVNHFVQSAVIRRGATYDIVRWITFAADTDSGKARPEVALSHKHGDLHLINYGDNLANSKKAFAWLFEQLGGFQIRAWELHAGQGTRALDNVEEDIDDINKGFDFIERSFRTRKIGNTGFKQLQWVTVQTRDSRGLLYKWSERLVKEALKQLRDEGALAKTITDCPYTIKTFQPWFVDHVLAELVPHLKVRSIGFVGRCGCGKTPVMEGIAAMFSRYWNRVLKSDNDACYRTAVDLDFFRGDVGTVDRPDGLDDADPRVIPPAKFKAFTDVGLVEAMTRERWGASKWVRNQLRLFAFNPHDVQAEPARGDPAVEPLVGEWVTHGQFMSILEPIWHKDFDHASKMAVVKRACVVIITDDWCYWRVADDKEKRVQRIKLDSIITGGSKYLVAEDARPVIKSWKDGRAVLPEDYEEQLELEARWMNAALSEGALDIPRLQPARAPAPVIPDAASPAGSLLYDIPLPASPAAALAPPVLSSRASMLVPSGAAPVAPVPSAAAPSEPRRGRPCRPSTGPGASTAMTNARAALALAFERGTGERAKKARKIEQLKQELCDAQAAFGPMPAGAKSEADDPNSAEPFSDLAADFARETKDSAVLIEDSPVKQKQGAVGIQTFAVALRQSPASIDIDE